MKPSGVSNLWQNGDADSLLQQALNALIYGDAAAAAEAARVALSQTQGPEGRTYHGWATWMLGLAHLYANDAPGALPYLQRAQEVALQTHQPTLAMAVYLAQQLETSYQQQHQMRQYATRLLKQLEEQELKITQQFQAMLRFARDSWPSMQIGGAAPGPATPYSQAGGSPRPIPRSDGLPPLNVQMLGAFLVRVGDHEVNMRQSRKAADILKFMLAHRVRPTTKDTLLHTLWPDVDIKVATHRLHLAISALRQILGAGTTDAAGYVIFRDDAYFFNPLATINLDVDRFIEHARQGKALDRAGRVAEALGPYESAVDLYQDDYLSDNLNDDWTASTRTFLREMYLQILARLCEGYLQAGRAEDCLQVARRMLARDVYREDAHRYVMRCLHLQGQRNQALLQYQICEEVLGADLGVSPTTPTTELYLRIKNEGE